MIDLRVRTTPAQEPSGPYRAQPQPAAIWFPGCGDREISFAVPPGIMVHSTPPVGRPVWGMGLNWLESNIDFMKNIGVAGCAPSKDREDERSPASLFRPPRLHYQNHGVPPMEYSSGRPGSFYFEHSPTGTCRYIARWKLCTRGGEGLPLTDSSSFYRPG